MDTRLMALLDILTSKPSKVPELGTIPKRKEKDRKKKEEP